MIKDARYRICDYDDDGQYNIHWVCCDSHMRMCDWQASYFKFCPFCGKAGAKKLECRSSDTPRWAYDLHTDCYDAREAAYRASVQEGKLYTQSTRWVVEERTSSRGEWHDWKHGKSEWHNAKDALKQVRLKMEMADEDRIGHESIAYRLRLVTGKYKTCTTQKIVERPEWIRDDVGLCAAANNISREEAFHQLVRESLDKHFSEA